MCYSGIRAREVEYMKGKRVWMGAAMLGIAVISSQWIARSVSSEVKQIQQVKEELQGISEEEVEVLTELFILSQEIIETEQAIERITTQIGEEAEKVVTLEEQINQTEERYDDQLNILEKVLIYYQRSGPASYLEMLLSADSLTDFLKTIHVMKDMSRNVNDLLVDLEESKLHLEEDKRRLEEQLLVLEEKKDELEEPLLRKRALKAEQEAYLDSLKDKKEIYRKQLEMIEQTWEECKLLFPSIVSEITKIVNEGYLTTDDLSIVLGFTEIEGTLYADDLNYILAEYSDLQEVTFTFSENQVVIDVPELSLVLEGVFVIEGKTGMRLEIHSGTFYQLPLEQSSIDELFQAGDVVIDFKTLAGDMLLIDFEMKTLEMMDGYMDFTIRPIFLW